MFGGFFHFNYMPIEGLEAAASPTEPTAQPTPDAATNNTGADTSGTGTDTTQTNQAPTEKTFTQADIDRIVANRIKSGVKAELKKMSGEGDGTPTVEDLQRQLSDEKTARHTLEARQTVRDYLSDPKHKLDVKPENVAAIEKLVMQDIVFDETGKPSNLKEAIESAKSLASSLFVNTPSSINAGLGRNGAVIGNDMNAWVRQQAGHG